MTVPTTASYIEPNCGSRPVGAGQAGQLQAPLDENYTESSTVIDCRNVMSNCAA